MIRQQHQWLFAFVLFSSAIAQQLSAQNFYVEPMGTTVIQQDTMSPIVGVTPFGDVQFQQAYSVPTEPQTVINASPQDSYSMTYAAGAEIPNQVFGGSQTFYSGAATIDGYGQFAGPDVIVSPDYGYSGPGDMRTHLWNDHQGEMSANGWTQAQVETMSLATAQKWHNYFHGTQGLPSERQ
jgi:hypothetical protein